MKDKKYYMSLNYPVIIKQFFDEDEDEVIFSAEIKELPGLKVYGDSLEEVYEDIDGAKDVWIESRIKDGKQIEEPRDMPTEFSGRLTARIGKGLHKRVADFASIEGLSINQSLISLLEQGLSAEKVSKLEKILQELVYKQDKSINALFAMNAQGFVIKNIEAQQNTPRIKTKDQNEIKEFKNFDMHKYSINGKFNYEFMG